MRDFALDMVRYLYMPGQHQTSRAFVESFLDQWTKDSGRDDQYVISAQALLEVSKVSLLLHWGNLARVVRLCGDYEEACDLGEEAHAFGIQELDVEHWVTLRAAKDRSIALRRANRYDEALTTSA